MTAIQTATREAVEGIARFLAANPDGATDLERDALAALDADRDAAIQRGINALEQPTAEAITEGGTVETFVLFPNVQRRTAPAANGLVYCEAHPDQHIEGPSCVWPHYVTPAGREPRVGHPCRSND